MNGPGRGNGQSGGAGSGGTGSGGTPAQNGYPAADRGAGYPDPAFRNGQHGGYGQAAGYGQQGYPPVNYDQRGHRAPDRGYGQDGYYPGYGGGAR